MTWLCNLTSGNETFNIAFLSCVESLFCLWIFYHNSKEGFKIAKNFQKVYETISVWEEIQTFLPEANRITSENKPEEIRWQWGKQPGIGQLEEAVLGFLKRIC